MTDEATFIEAILQAPTDEVLRLVFADWLDERGRWRAAQLMRENAKLRVEDRGISGWAVWNVTKYGWEVSFQREGDIRDEELYLKISKRNSRRMDRCATYWATERDGMRAILDALLTED